ncbi:MAG: 5-formyltetrahydrofolate cyclo-ligase [Phycisphaerales bacterium]|nr:5-formyltetrahydrofolate cyclo-ligase [Phycisphaerales bacterium]
MELYVHELDKDVLVVAVDGGLSAQTAEQFTEEVERVAARGFTKIIVDSSALSFISSSGIGALLMLHKRMKARGVHVKVAGPRNFVLDVLRIARLDTLFEIYPDVSRARLAFSAREALEQSDDPAPSAETVKARTREQLKLALVAMAAPARAEASRRLVAHALAMPEWAGAQAVMLFWPRVEVEERPSGAEPDIRPLIAAALEAGKTVCLPRVDWSTKTIQPARVTKVPEDLEPDQHAPVTGLLQPRAGCPGIEIGALDLILVPGLGFDLAGHRIGRGAGFYDRFLGDLSPTSAGNRPYRLGVCFDTQILRAIPTQTHDQTMHGVATPSGLVRATSAAAPAAPASLPGSSPDMGIAATPSQ